MPAQILPVYEKQFLYRYNVEEFYDCGMDSYTSPPAQNPAMCQSLQNVFPGASALKVRWAYDQFSATAVGTSRFLGMYQKDSTGDRRVIFGNSTTFGALNEDGTTYNAAIVTVTAQGRALSSRSYMYFFDGNSADNKKWDGSAVGGVTAWGITAPATTAALGAPVAGAITIKSGRKYFVIFQNSSTLHCSDLSPVTASSGPLTAQNQPLSTIPVSSDAQVDKVIILATADGGDETLLYYVATINNGTTTYTDATPETTLLTNNIFFETDSTGIEHGVVGNTPPPAGSLCIKHKGRFVMAKGQFLYPSKSYDETVTSTGAVTGHYEECFPADWAIDISEGTETVTGLMTDGVVLYIGTERMIRRIYGDDITTFSKPEIIFNETGLLTQNVWQRVFMEGNPVGAVWLTPDFRVIQSDFNTYKDIGSPIQDQLNTINTAAATKASAMSVSNGAYDVYILNVPTGANTECDTQFVYNLRSQKWAVWKLQPADQSTLACLYNITAAGVPQALFTTSTGCWKFDPAAVSDKGATRIALTIQTSWLPLGEPGSRKVLNEIEVSTLDSGMTVTVEGASLQSDFASPVVVVSNAALVASPLGPLKVYLAGQTTKHRFYRFTFSSSNTDAVKEGLGGYSIEYALLHQL